jgi:hypothetical protein
MRTASDVAAVGWHLFDGVGESFAPTSVGEGGDAPRQLREQKASSARISAVDAAHKIYWFDRNVQKANAFVQQTMSWKPQLNADHGG